MDRRAFQGQRRIHDQVEPSIRADQKGEVGKAVALARLGDVENFSGIFEERLVFGESAHAKCLSNKGVNFSEDFNDPFEASCRLT
jgi:hypothetical protein